MKDLRAGLGPSMSAMFKILMILQWTVTREQAQRRSPTAETRGIFTLRQSGGHGPTFVRCSGTAASRAPRSVRLPDAFGCPEKHRAARSSTPVLLMPERSLADDALVYSFTLLPGILVSDVDEPMGGNSTVWPNTYLRVERYFRERDGHSLEHADGMTSGVRLPRPVPITGKTDDILLAHYQPASTASPTCLTTFVACAFAGSRCADSTITASSQCRISGVTDDAWCSVSLSARPGTGGVRKATSRASETSRATRTVG